MMSSREVGERFMSCRKIQENLWEFQQGSLSEGQAIKVVDHLANCAECRSFLESLKLIDLDLDRFGEICPSPYFDHKLNARLDGVKRISWYSPFLRLLKQRYALSFALLFLGTVGVWVGIRHYQAAKLKTLEDVIRVQEKYVGRESGPDVTRNSSPIGSQRPGATVGQSDSSISGRSEEVIPEEDRVLVENIDLLENYEFIKKLDLAETQVKVKSSMGTN
jgi:hypothetical protein